MNYKLLVLLTTFYLLTSCTSSENKTEKPDSSSVEIKNESSVINCYQYATQSDTITLKLVHVGDAITGTLVYSLKEKDKNKGTILGNMQGDILVARYTFFSEGVKSVRPVAFKMEGNTFVEGYGDVDTNGDKVSFRNIDSLQFNSSMKLIEIVCKQG